MLTDENITSSNEIKWRYSASNSANSIETMRLYNSSDMSETDWAQADLNSSYSKEVKRDAYKQKILKTKLLENSDQSNIQKENPEQVKTKKSPFNYQTNKKFKEDSIPPPDLRIEVEQRKAELRANKIGKTSYMLDIEKGFVGNWLKELNNDGNRYFFYCNTIKFVYNNTKFKSKNILFKFSKLIILKIRSN